MLLAALTAALAQADEPEKITVALSQPGRPGMLKASLMSGSIKVSGYKGREVVVSYSSREGKVKDKPPVEAEGLRRISNNNIGLEIREENNTVTVKNAGLPLAVDLQIMVPNDFSLKLKTMNGGSINVEDVNGELEIDNLTGNINLRNVAGSASASTLNGNIVAAFNKVTDNMPMAFSSLNGTIDVTLPAAAKFNAKLKTDNGDIFTDFDMAMDKGGKTEVTTNKLRNSDASAGTRLYIDKWLYGKINGGGPDLLLKNFNGNIYIRKSK